MQHCDCEHVIHEPTFPKWQKWGHPILYWFEVILINVGGTAHPIHQHGGWYSVVGMGQYDTKMTINDTYIKEKDKECKRGERCLPRNFDWPVSKDTIQVPTNGYVIFRTPINNPGVWIVHCHINAHVLAGMAMVFQIGGLGEKKLKIEKWAAPQDWPLDHYKGQINKKCPKEQNKGETN